MTQNGVSAPTRADLIMRAFARELTSRKGELDDDSLRIITLRVKVDKVGVPRAVEFEASKHREI